ncbi:MAG: phage holin family protein [Fusobacteriaceae bacterium]
MNDTLMNKVDVLFQALSKNPYIYLLAISLLHLLGGLDELLKALLCLNTIDIILCLMSKDRPNKGVMIGKIKLLIVVILGTLLDKMLGLENHPRLSARNGLIYGYGYNECVSIINTLCLDPTFYVPSILKSNIEKLKTKGGDDINEQDE